MQEAAVTLRSEKFLDSGNNLIVDDESPKLLEFLLYKKHCYHYFHF